MGGFLKVMDTLEQEYYCCGALARPVVGSIGQPLARFTGFRFELASAICLTCAQLFCHCQQWQAKTQRE
jgi:hypothetical protein